jgi:excisionase family DNA binding protein
MDEILSVAEAARILGVTPNTVRLRLGKGAMPGKKVGRDWALLRSEVERQPKGRWEPGAKRKSPA